jgi:hypothetical protein
VRSGLQPLYVPGLTGLPGKPPTAAFNVVFIVTLHAQAYAFDADKPGSPPLWHTDFTNASTGVTAASAADVACLDEPEYGILGTPAINLESGIMYFTACTLENGVVTHR